MRKRTSLLAAVVAAAVWAASALAASPAQIYNNYVQTGRLSCSYSRGELEALLRSGSINQYGDPLTLARLKLAARKQLAGGCRERASGGSTVTTGGGTTSTPTKPHARSKRPPQSHLKRPPRLAAGVKASASGGNGSFVAGRVLIVGLLAVAIAFGGWLTKRALSARD